MVSAPTKEKKYFAPELPTELLLAANAPARSHGEALEAGQAAARLVFHQIGEDPEREGLRQTPERFAKAINDICSGYTKTLAEVVGKGIFKAEGQGLVAVKRIEFFSLCEHHMLPFWGHVSVAYYPNEKILGLSKVARIVELFARRLQVQERLTREVADAMAEAVLPKAVGVRIQAAHTCMMMRGVQKQASETVTEYFSQMETLSALERERLVCALDG
ncbi:MAG: GTP cyclohydrolase I FolE [Bdellovibrionaceae bacterium]|nr:GTP cyclohydrolase I FolE [Bdellovibrionales bacterium]MCB9254277.1 GTP cyclohydrolase I FolE [Pseudobdellovibrionaceae bacterium]